MVIKDQFSNNDIKICQPKLFRLPANVQSTNNENMSLIKQSAIS